jgi:hypothetical protein
MRISAVPFEGRRSSLLRWLAFTAIVGCVLLPSASAAAPPTPAVAPPAASLTAQWWQTYVSIPSGAAATRCNLGTSGIVFLGATATGSVNGSCTLKAGTSILLPLINIECSSLEPEPFFGATPNQRRVCAKRFADDFTNFVLTINGVDVLGDPTRLRVQSGPFEFSPVNGNIFGIPAGTGGSASDGYWALIGPLAPGDYEIFASGSYPPGPFSTSISYHLHVV